jgi:hypothetical protein
MVSTWAIVLVFRGWYAELAGAGAHEIRSFDVARNLSRMLAADVRRRALPVAVPRFDLTRSQMNIAGRGAKIAYGD